MAVFGLPDSHEDDALRAVRAAAALRRDMETLNEAFERDLAVRLAIRTGVTTGEAVTGDPSLRQSLVTGDVVNTAKRLEESAGVGEIVIGAATRALVASAATLEPLPNVAAKGKRDAVAAWRVVAVDDDAPGYRAPARQPARRSCRGAQTAPRRRRAGRDRATRRGRDRGAGRRASGSRASCTSCSMASPAGRPSSPVGASPTAARHTGRSSRSSGMPGGLRRSHARSRARTTSSCSRAARGRRWPLLGDVHDGRDLLGGPSFRRAQRT